MPHEATECGNENFEFIVSERVKVKIPIIHSNECVNIFIIQIEHTAKKQKTLVKV